LAKNLGLIPLREKVKELERVYGRVQKEIASELFSVEIMDYRETKAIKVQERIDALIRKLNRIAIRWVRESVPMAYKESYIITKTKLEKLRAKKDVLFNARDHRFSVEDYIEKAMKDLITANQSIRTNVNMYIYLARKASANLTQLQAFGAGDEEVISSIILDAIEEGQARAYASKRIHEYLRLQLLDGKFIDKAGRNYNLRDYSKMVARTRLRQAQTDAVKNTCRQHNNDLVQWSRHANPCPECSEHEGKIYSLSGKHPIYPFIPAEPPLHPNCEHDLSPTSEVAIEYREAYV